MRKLPYSVNAINFIAYEEFSRAVMSPITITICVIITTYAILNCAGLQYYFHNSGYSVYETYLLGIGNVFSTVSTFLTAIAVFIGIMSIIEDSRKNVFKILLTKPLYRRDVIIGKFMGINAFLLVLVTLTFTLIALMLAVFYVMPYDVSDWLLRIGSLITITFLECSIASGIMIIAGVMFSKNLLGAVGIAASFFFLEWHFAMGLHLGDLDFLSPRFLLFSMYGLGNIWLTDPSYSLLEWFNSASPYILLAVVEALLVMLFGAFLFSRSEEN